jgi:predicted YcjX-like family ATPase
MPNPGPRRWLHVARDAVQRSVRTAAELAQSSHIRLGVTGLSGAGKTVFTTAFAHALAHLRNNPAELALLDVAMARDRRIVRVALEEMRGLPRFPVEENVRKLLAAMPAWPEATHGLSGVRVVVRFAPRGLVGRIAEEAVLRIDIVDYPGEWLVDLPLLRQDYRLWSIATWNDLANEGTEEGRALGRAWREAADAAPAPGGIDRRALSYGRLLRELKGDRFGWSWLTPGRGLTWSEQEWLASGCAFFPLPPEALASGPTFHALNQRFNRYVDTLVKPFYRDHLRNLDRQIVLVDLLGALSRGPDSFHGMRRALGAILAHFRYGGGWRVLRPLLGRRIARVMVAATKADLVTEGHRPALRSLLRETVDWSVMEKLKDYQEVVQGRTHYAVACLASIASSTEEIGQHGEIEFRLLRGRAFGGGGEEEKIVPSPVPPSLPKLAAWPARGFKYYLFDPPDLSAYAESAFPHYGLDAAMRFLIGDKVR